MHTWLCCMATSINRHDNSLLFRGKCALNAKKEHEVGFKLHVSELFILNFFFFLGKSAKMQCATGKHNRWSRNNCVRSATIATLHTHWRTLELMQWR